MLLTRCSSLVSRWANATLGTSCVVENVPYIAYGESGEFIDIVSRYVFLCVLVMLSAQRLCRGNCEPGLYCDSVQKTCMTSLAIGATCSADKEYACLIFASSGTNNDHIDATLGIVSVVESADRVRLLLISLGLGCMF